MQRRRWVTAVCMKVEKGAREAGVEMDAENRKIKASGRAPSKSLRRQRNHQNMRVLKLQWKKVWGGTKGCQPATHATPAKCCKNEKKKSRKDGSRLGGRGDRIGPRVCPWVPLLIGLQSSCCLSLRLRMSLSSHHGLFARLGHRDGPVLHDLDTPTVRVINGLLVGIFLVEFESIGLEWIHLEFTARRKVPAVNQ